MRLGLGLHVGSRRAGVAGGGGAPEIANLIAGYDNDFLAAAGAGALAQWDDVSGTDRHLLMATEADRPVVVTGVQNGRPALRFDGTGDNMQTANFTSVVVTAGTFFLPISVAAGSDSGVFYFLKSGGNFISLIAAMGSSQRMIFSAGASLVSTNDAAGKLTADTVYLITLILNGASSIIRINGADNITGNAGAGSGAVTGIRLGETAFDEMDGDHFGPRFYNRVLDAAEIESVESYYNELLAIY